MIARWLAGLLVVLSALWSGWWFVGSHLQATALERWLDERRAAGWVAEAGSIRTAGFPNRFDTRVEGLHLANTRAGWAWESPFIDILMMAWEPHAAILALPPGQMIAVPGGRARLDATPLRASVRLGPAASLPLVALSAEAGTVRLTAENGWQGGADSLSLHLRRLDQSTNPGHAYAAYAEASAVQLPQPLRDLVDPLGVLAPVADSLVFDARASLDGPLDRRTVEGEAPGIHHLQLERVALRWGSLALEAAGTLRADSAGLAEGRLTLRAENWRELLAAFVRGGLIGRGTADALELALGFLERPGPAGGMIEVPVSFANGRTGIGPLTIGVAPRLRHVTGRP